MSVERLKCKLSKYLTGSNMSKYAARTQRQGENGFTLQAKSLTIFLFLRFYVKSFSEVRTLEIVILSILEAVNLDFGLVFYQFLSRSCSETTKKSILVDKEQQKLPFWQYLNLWIVILVKFCNFFSPEFYQTHNSTGSKFISINYFTYNLTH